MTTVSPNDSPSNSEQQKGRTRQMLIDLMICILLPTLILKKLSTDQYLGSNWALIFALSLPLAVGIIEFIRARKVGFVPALGFISILLTGGIGLLKLPNDWIAIKEALIPFAFAVAAAISTLTKHPLIRTFFYNDLILDTSKIAAQLEEHDHQEEFEQIMKNATWMLTASFVLSSVLNYLLAKWIIVSPTGTAEFNDELGTMTMLSYPVIAVPSMIIMMYALFYVIRHVKRLTGLSIEDVMHH